MYTRNSKQKFGLSLIVQEAHQSFPQLKYQHVFNNKTQNQIKFAGLSSISLPFFEHTAIGDTPNAKKSKQWLLLCLKESTSIIYDSRSISIVSEYLPNSCKPILLLWVFGCLGIRVGDVSPSIGIGGGRIHVTSHRQLHSQVRTEENMLLSCVLFNMS